MDLRLNVVLLPQNRGKLSGQWTVIGVLRNKIQQLFCE